MRGIIARSMAQRRGIALLLSIFSVLALALAAIGIYGVVSYTVARRVHEIGIRMALGAQRREVLGFVVWQGMRTVAIGMALGLASSFAVTRLLSKVLFGVTPADPLALLSAGATLSSIALLGVYFPARRTARIDPAVPGAFARRPYRPRRATA